MIQLPNRAVLAVACLLATAACASRGPAAPPPDPEVMAAAARADSVRAYYNQADVDFMTGMIHHHAQALVMANMAPTHGASDALRILTARIINAQKDEIELMRRWLRERGEPVPEVRDDGTVVMPGGAMGGHVGHGAGHAAGGMASMAGMLTPDQLAELDAARGEEWDRLFLTFMIQHHQGAVTMVKDLFASPGAGQGDEIFKIASDISADQASEIDRMQRMLRDLLFGPGT